MLSSTPYSYLESEAAALPPPSAWRGADMPLGHLLSTGDRRPDRVVASLPLQTFEDPFLGASWSPDDSDWPVSWRPFASGGGSSNSGGGRWRGASPREEATALADHALYCLKAEEQAFMYSESHTTNFSPAITPSPFSMEQQDSCFAGGLSAPPSNYYGEPSTPMDLNAATPGPSKNAPFASEDDMNWLETFQHFSDDDISGEDLNLSPNNICIDDLEKYVFGDDPQCASSSSAFMRDDEDNNIGLKLQQQQQLLRQFGYADQMRGVVPKSELQLQQRPHAGQQPLVMVLQTQQYAGSSCSGSSGARPDEYWQEDGGYCAGDATDDRKDLSLLFTPVMPESKASLLQQPHGSSHITFQEEEMKWPLKMEAQSEQYGEGYDPQCDQQMTHYARTPLHARITNTPLPSSAYSAASSRAASAVPPPPSHSPYARSAGSRRGRPKKIRVPEDKRAMSSDEKRKAMNRDAALRYRERRKVEFAALKDEEEHLEGRNSDLRAQARALEERLEDMKNRLRAAGLLA